MCVQTEGGRERGGDGDGRREREEKEKGEEKGGRERERASPTTHPHLRPSGAILVWGRLWLLELLEISLWISKNECPSLAPLGVVFCSQQS